MKKKENLYSRFLASQALNLRPQAINYKQIYNSNIQNQKYFRYFILNLFEYQSSRFRI